MDKDEFAVLRLVQHSWGLKPCKQLQHSWGIEAVQATLPPQPRKRIKYAEKEVARYREDVESSNGDHNSLATDCSVCEDMIAKANFIFDRIIHVDIEIQQYILLQGHLDEADLQEDLRGLLNDWLELSTRVVSDGKRLQEEYGRAEGLETLKDNAREARSILTPDDEFFDHEKLSSLGDEAVEAHRSGLTEPLLEDERSH